jgi:hypothetical protein
MYGMRGGMPGSPGPGGFGMRGGMPGPGRPGGGAPPVGEGGGPGGPGGFGGFGGTGVDAIDDAPFYVVAVIEVQPHNKAQMAAFKKGSTGLLFAHPSWGKALLQHKTYFYEAVPLETNTGGVLPSVSRTFELRYDQIMKGKPTTDDGLKLARWALEHGLVDDFVKVMDKVAETDKANPSVAAFLKVKADLAKPLSGEDAAGAWKDKLIDGYKITQTNEHHFALLHNSASDAVTEVKPQLDRLEKTFKGFYYWWALKGYTLPIPAKRQVAILTDPTKNEDFRKLKKHLTATPVMADSFFARREGLSVFAGKRADDSYVTLEKVSKPERDKGYIFNELLKGVTNPPRGAPKGTPLERTHLARTYALLLRALEHEWEATGISHEASRQLLYASGLLPHNVNAPEWLLFGVGSFFEKPLQSPYGGPGAPNSYYLPRFKEYLKANKYGANNYEALVKVVTDAGFRAKPVTGEPAERLQRQARAAAWSLYYFLAHQEMAKLQRYFKELAKMPRDVELDEKVLLQTFARSFDCVNPDKSVNTDQLTNLAARWISFINLQAIEADAVHKKIRDYHQEIVKARTTGAPGAGAPGRPGGGGIQ